MSIDVKEKKQNPFTLDHKLWSQVSWVEQKSVNQFLTEYGEIQKKRERYSVEFALENTALEIQEGRCSLRFFDGGSWSDNFYFTNFAWSKLGMFFPRYFTGFTKDCRFKFGEQSEDMIEELYHKIANTSRMSDRKLTFRLEHNVDNRNIIRTVVSESFAELDDDLLLNKLREDKNIQDKFVLNSRISDVYTNIRIGNTVPNQYELMKPIGMVEFSNADNGGKSLKARSGKFTGKCWNSLCSLDSKNIKRWYHTGDVNRITDNISSVYDLLFKSSEELIVKYQKAQNIPVKISDHFRLFHGKGKKKKLITHGHLLNNFNEDIACKSLIDQSVPNATKPNGKHINALVKSPLTWKDSRMITETQSLARCVDALTLHAQQYNMENRVQIEDYATYLLEKYIDKKEIVIDPTEKLVIMK
tara:strand:- start:7 stop:1251 length:1245 start_codon:yes stop_codon:yes gene_type:complete